MFKFDGDALWPIPWAFLYTWIVWRITGVKKRVLVLAFASGAVIGWVFHNYV
jgi:hypothetical protein